MKIIKINENLLENNMTELERIKEKLIAIIYNYAIDDKFTYDASEEDIEAYVKDALINMDEYLTKEELGIVHNEARIWGISHENDLHGGVEEFWNDFDNDVLVAIVNKFKIEKIKNILVDIICNKLIKKKYDSDTPTKVIEKVAQEVCTNSDEYLNGDDYNFIEKIAKNYNKDLSEFNSMRYFYKEFDKNVIDRAIDKFKKTTVTENLSKEDTKEIFTPEEQEEYNCDEEGNCIDGYDVLHHCGWCDDIFTEYEMRKEARLGWLCPQCQAALRSRGEFLELGENLSKEDTNIKIDKNYLKNLQANHNKHNKKYKRSRSTLTKVNAGNVEYNISMFNKMNNPVGKPINPFTFDGSSLINNALADVSTPNTIAVDAGGEATGGDSGAVAGGMGENLSFDEAWELMNSLDEGLLTEASDNRDGLKNLLAVKTKLNGGTGCIWYNSQGKIGDTMDLSSPNLSGNSLETTIQNMRGKMEKGGYDSFRIYNKSKVVYDSLLDKGSGTTDENEIIVKVAKKTNPDDVDIYDVEGGKVSVPVSGESKQTIEAKTTTDLCLKLYKLNSEDYLYWVYVGNKEVFNTINPQSTAAGKALGIKKQSDNKIVNKVKDKLGIGIITPLWGERKSTDDCYFIFSSDGREAWREYISKDQVSKLTKEAIENLCKKKLEGAADKRPPEVDPAVKIDKVILVNASGDPIKTGAIDKENNYRWVVFKVVDRKTQIVKQKNFTLTPSKEAIKSRIEDYINNHDLLSSYKDAKNTCIEIYNPLGDMIYFIDKFNARRENNGDLIEGQPKYDFASASLKKDSTNTTKEETSTTEETDTTETTTDTVSTGSTTSSESETTTADASTDASKKIGGASASSYVKNLIKNDPKLSDKAKATILGKLNS